MAIPGLGLSKYACIDLCCSYLIAREWGSGFGSLDMFFVFLFLCAMNVLIYFGEINFCSCLHISYYPPITMRLRANLLLLCVLSVGKLEWCWILWYVLILSIACSLDSNIVTACHHQNGTYFAMSLLKLLAMPLWFVMIASDGNISHIGNWAKWWGI